MSLHNQALLSKLQKKLPEGVVASSAWLADEGYSRQLVYKYVHSGWLDKLCHGAYIRSGSFLEWQGVVLGLQQLLGSSLYIGGLTALNLQGYAHYLPLAGEKKIHLYGSKKLPKWVNTIYLNQEFQLHSKLLFSEEVSQLAFKQSETKVRDWMLNISSPERAILEVLHGVETHGISFEHADELIQGLTTLRPKLINSLLQACKNEKVVRLFLFFADHNNYAWNRQINRNDLVLSKRKIQVVEGGRLDKRYRITVPKSFGLY